MKNKRGLVACILFLIVFAIVTIYRETKQTKEAVYQQNEGIIFNTIYHITYQYNSDLQAEIEDELHLFDAIDDRAKALYGIVEPSCVVICLRVIDFLADAESYRRGRVITSGDTDGGFVVISFGNDDLGCEYL
mgnify:CR=1 FL=1